MWAVPARSALRWWSTHTWLQDRRVTCPQKIQGSHQEKRRQNRQQHSLGRCKSHAASLAYKATGLNARQEQAHSDRSGGLLELPRAARLRLGALHRIELRHRCIARLSAQRSAIATQESEQCASRKGLTSSPALFSSCRPQRPQVNALCGVQWPQAIAQEMMQRNIIVARDGFLDQNFRLRAQLQCVTEQSAHGRHTRFANVFIDDWRADVFTGEELERTLGYVDAVRFLEEPGHSLAEMAIRFAFSDPAVSAAIPGARNPQQAEALMNAWRAGPLPEETLKRLDELWRTTFSRHIQTSIQGATVG